MDSHEYDEGQSSGLDRRSVLKRGAVLGGGLIWTVPAVQTIAGPAFAAGSPRCYARLEGEATGNDCVSIVYADTADCCDCINGYTMPVAPAQPLPVPMAIALCAWAGKCTEDRRETCS